MHIITTGGAGFIGLNLAFALQEKHEVLIIDKMRSDKRLDNGNLESFGHFKNLLDLKGELFVNDIYEARSFDVMREFKPDIIFHQTAISDTTAYDQTQVLGVNLSSFKDFIKLATKCGSKLIYASFASVYGDMPSPQKVGYEESKNPYAFSKLMVDKLARKYSNELHIVGLRYLNIYGKNEFLRGKTALMILQLGLQILSGKSPRLFEGSERICRDFTYIRDVVGANLRALDAKSGIHNVGSGKARTFKDIVDILQKELGTNLDYEWIENPYKKAYQFHTQAHLDENFYKGEFELEAGIKDHLPEIKRIFEKEYNA